MIHRFLEKDETPKPTIAIDYSFGRKAGKSLVSFHLLMILYYSNNK